MKSPADLRLYLVTDRNLSRNRPIEDIVMKAVEGGISAVQLREKNTPTGEFLSLALILKKILPANIPLIINDRIDIALASGADGAHIGQEDMPYLKARALLGPAAIIGLSVENEEQAYAAENLDVDYLGVSPIFTTPTKSELTFEWGIEGLKRLRKMSSKPLVAIGGISQINAARVLEAGADGLAVVSAICSASNPEKASAELREIIDSSLKT